MHTVKSVRRSFIGTRSVWPYHFHTSRILAAAPAAATAAATSQPQMMISMSATSTLSRATTAAVPKIFRFIRFMSNLPENSVYGGPKPQSPNQRITLTQIRQKHQRSQPITVVTAYDYPSAVHLDMAGIDIGLVGDSAAMVVHGHDTTLPISVDEMLVHCRSVSRGAKRALLVGDLPFGCYESSPKQVPCTSVLSTVL